MDDTQTLDDILDSVLIGMYVRRPSSNGLDMEYLPLDDRYNVLRQEAKRAIREAIERAKPPKVTGHIAQEELGKNVNLVIDAYESNLLRNLGLEANQ